MKKKIKQLFQRTVAMIMALLTAVSVIPASTAMAATQKATITFEYAYDSKGNAIYYQKTVTHGGITCGHAGETRVRIYADGDDAYCIQPGISLHTGDKLDKNASDTWNALSKGNPNEEGGAYQQAISVLYAVAYTLKMSYKTDYKIEGFFEYVVPPLEGFWWQDDVEGVDYTNKSAFNWISVIRLPDFVSKENFDWAVETATKKKKLDCSSTEYLTIDEGLCVQIMHLGSFDDEQETVALMDTYLEQNGYVNDINEDRLHHEIYLSDARKVAPEKWKTVIRHPIKKI